MLTFVAVFNQSLVDMLLFGVFKNVKETKIDGVWLFQDDV